MPDRQPTWAQYWADVYDQLETQTDDVALLRGLLDGLGHLRILEPFCGNGRMYIPLAADGHEIVGIDVSDEMLASGRAKLAKSPTELRERVTLLLADATAGGWPTGFDLVILGANCFYELPTAEAQRGCIQSAHNALKPGGWLYLDNNHMEGDLDPAWCRVGETSVRPSVTCPDGSLFSETVTTIWVDRPNRIWRADRVAELRLVSGDVLRHAYTQQKHPPSTGEMREWLEEQDFSILGCWGDRKQSPCTDQSGRAIFWAQHRP